MEQVLLVYKTDPWHSYASRDLIGVTTHKWRAHKICQEQARKEGEEISEEEMWNLKNLKQTQGYSGEGEFQYEEVDTNVLL